MSETKDTTGAPSSTQNWGGASSPGTLLREAREAAGLHIASLAVSLKVPVRKLEALEADQFELLPDAVFVRALASSVCRTLKVDPAPVLALLPQSAGPRLARDESGINTPFRAPPSDTGFSRSAALSRPLVLAVVVLLVAALAILFLPRSLTGEAGLASVINDAVTSPIPAAQPVPAQAPMINSTPQPGAAATPGSKALAMAGAVINVPVTMAPARLTPTLSTPTVLSPTVVIKAPAPAPSPLAGAAAAAAPATDGIVVFRAKGQTWIEVVDVNGTVALRRVLMPGETAGASGTPPLRVVVGRAESTEVVVRGRPFDLGAFARDSVARFEVR
ncbi:MAG: helix-turn-helix domain-containing protein [Burkholderiaceae bacterium]|nr:helix-turn-helix domain-containing protein [Burkholderiaceae bacterium]MDO9090236.1 helix-turn-helix domain-containing protein [Burkholderiaceae bacterium]MDP1968304.1 helix-turn-helix domain-containing protein [Burkholderiaceae bacterium]